MTRLLPAVLPLALITLVACSGGDDGDTPAADGSVVDVADALVPVEPDATPVSLTELITGTWSKAPGSDSYWCSYLKVQEDMYITAFEAMAPTGTHHTVLSVTNDNVGLDREEACSVGTVAEQLLYASGVGTDPYPLPEGVALKITAGQTLMLQLHLFNASEQVLAGTSGARVLTAELEDVEHLAEFVLAGTVDVNIPGDGTDHSATGSCTMQEAGTVFTFWPHMHQVGKHMKISHNANVLHDNPYSFNDQKMYAIEPVPVSPGDTINVECTWNNPQGNATKTWGDGSEDEMCFAGIYRYPATGASSYCFF